ncbi:MAG TPA: hypothetical protein VJ302_13270 [Blastocatellia bacterium]|nr:hypothetical protein [Blastocatellia bacterium]
MTNDGPELLTKLDAPLPDEPEPRWPALIAILAVGGLYTALPANFSLGPPWLFPSVVLVLLVPTVISHQAGRHHLNHFLGLTVTGVLTLRLIFSLVRLIEILLVHGENADSLLLSATLLWVTNILIFALWYWRLDAGGPHQRDRAPGHSEGAFLFPQMTMSEEALKAAGQENWSPNFVDYLFLAFNTSTAFSPTDVPVLTRWAKLLMMLQSLLSLTIIALLAARAVNML